MTATRVISNDGSLPQIIRKTGRKPSSCKCQQCKNQCRTPCLGTPNDILKLIEAGYGSRLKPTMWCVGMVLGKLTYPIPMIQAVTEDNGWCTFRREDGLCELHDLGLKPTEGRLSHHSITLENFKFSKSLSYNVAKEWLRDDSYTQIESIINSIE